MPILNMGEVSIKIHTTRVPAHDFQERNNIGCSLSWIKESAGQTGYEISIGKS